MIKKNEIITLEIDSITNLGFGVGRYNGIVVFVSGAVTGDVAEIKIIKTAASYCVGRIEKIIRKSSLRVSDRCEISGCTSCAYKCVNYVHECELKETDVKTAFSKANLPDVKIMPLVPSPKLKGYRNKAQYPIKLDKNGEYVVGFYAPKSHRVTEARKCPLLPEIFSEIIDTATALFKERSLSVYNEESGEGLLRHIYLRRGEISGEILFTLVINGDTIPGADEFAKELTERHPEIVGVLINVNKEDTNVILGEKFIILTGRDYIYDTLSGVKLKITAPSFYQVNHEACELLYKKAKELAMPTHDDVLLDLFCGAGSIGLSMASEVKELIGIEIVESAVECAKENALANGISNAKFYTGDASNIENLLKNAESELGKKIEPDIVVFDPPRAGCTEVLLNFVANLNPKRIVYISCNPQTLARDAKILSELGYNVGEVTPFDLFPLTGHVESVVCLEKRT
jgi:23S rRNA (uracil1939-C5)-methyltransferase